MSYYPTNLPEADEICVIFLELLKSVQISVIRAKNITRAFALIVLSSKAVHTNKIIYLSAVAFGLTIEPVLL